MQTSMLTILGMALATYATRAGGLWLMGRVQPSPRVERWLRHIPGAVIVSIVAPIVAEGGPAELLATAATVGVGMRTKNVLLTMLTGVGVVWAARNAFISALDRLPLTLCHGDANRRNLFIRQVDAGSEQITAIDWSFMGLWPVGVELVPLVRADLFFFEVDFDKAKRLGAKLSTTANWRGCVIRVGKSIRAWCAMAMPRCPAALHARSAALLD